jgi:hypothetical protein
VLYWDTYRLRLARIYVPPMHAHRHTYQYVVQYTETFRSCIYVPTLLMQAIKSQLSYPELLTQSVYPRMTAHQASHAYLRQITDIDFPRLLILLYELGGIHGKWLWDGDEISHSWN